MESLHGLRGKNLSRTHRERERNTCKRRKETFSGMLQEDM